MLFRSEPSPTSLGACQLLQTLNATEDPALAALRTIASDGADGILEYMMTKIDLGKRMVQSHNLQLMLKGKIEQIKPRPSALLSARHRRAEGHADAADAGVAWSRVPHHQGQGDRSAHLRRARQLTAQAGITALPGRRSRRCRTRNRRRR